MALEDLTSLQFARLSGRMAESKERLPFAVVALKKFYSQFQATNGRTLEEDYVLNSAFARARAGIKAGHITDEGILGAIHGYSKEYDDSLKKTKIREIVQSAVNTGYKIPQEFTGYIRGYEELTLEELKVKADAKEEKAEKILAAIGLIEQQKFEGQLYSQLVKEMTDETLEALSKEQKESS